MARYIHLSIHDEERIGCVMSALSSPLRRDILRLVDQRSYSVSEIAKILKIPPSTAAFHVNNLQEADLIHVQTKAALRGSAKIISRKIDEITINCVNTSHSDDVLTKELDIPVGSFVDCSVSTSCGMASEENIIEMDDDPGVFYSPLRAKAQLIWFGAGYLEYRVPNYFLKGKEPIGLSVSMELCSEAPNYRNDWESDITFWINGRELCTRTSPGDFGGHRGRLNPKWYPDISSQYGLLKTVRINGGGTYLDENRMSAVHISDLDIQSGDYFTFRIGIKDGATNVGGINLFGEKFGNYAQNILAKFEYREEKQGDSI